MTRALPCEKYVTPFGQNTSRWCCHTAGEAAEAWNFRKILCGLQISIPGVFLHSGVAECQKRQNGGNSVACRGLRIGLTHERNGFFAGRGDGLPGTVLGHATLTQLSTPAYQFWNLGGVGGFRQHSFGIDCLAAGLQSPCV